MRPSIQRQFGQFGDELHDAGPAGRALGRILSGQLGKSFRTRQCLRFRRLRCLPQQLSTASKVIALAAIGQEPEMTDAHEGGRERMQHEAADEFLSRDRK